MTILGVTRMWSRNDTTVENSSTTINENYQVVHGIEEDIVSIYNGVDPVSGLRVPILNDSYNTNGRFLPDVRVSNVQLSQVSPIMSIASVTYSGTAVELDPTSTIKISWTDTESDEPIDEDFDGNPIVNPNGEPIEGITMKVADQVVTIERRFLSFSPYIVNAYRHSVNSDVFLDYPPGMARLIRYSAAFNGGMWDVSASIQFRYPYRTVPVNAWRARVRREGFYIRDTVGGPVRRALDSDITAGSPGEPVIKPVLIDSAGLIITDPAMAEWKEIKRYGSLPYNALGLL